MIAGEQPVGAGIFVSPGLRPRWQDLAACRGMNPDLFFPVRGDPSFTGALEAKAVCAGCPVRGDCLEFSMTSPRERIGVWGGLTEYERRALERRQVRVRRRGAA